MSAKSRHHVYCKRWRKSGKKYHETKLVNDNEHKAFHSICRDMHPERANRRIWAVIFVRSLALTATEKYARSVLMRGRSEQECYKHCLKNFLPTGMGEFKPLPKFF